MARHKTRMYRREGTTDRFNGVCTCGRTWENGTKAQIEQALKDHRSATEHIPDGDD